MNEFTLPLALVDFVPVLLTGIGFLYIVRLVSWVLPVQRRIALLGAVLIVTGGLLRATWKLLIVLSNGNLVISWMGDSLFVLMAPGYILVAWSVWQLARSVQEKQTFHPWQIPLALALLTWAISFVLANSQPDSLAWKNILITVTVLGNLAGGIVLVLYAFRRKLSYAGWLYIVNLLIVFVMNGLARAPEQTVLLHWIAESVDTVSCLCFAMAAWIMYQHAPRSVGGDPVVGAEISVVAK